MTLNLRSTLHATATAVLAAALVSGATVALGAVAAPPATATARPSTTPPWEPDPNSVGGLVFYNAAGDVVTGGSTSAAPIAAYVEGTKTIRAGDKKATLYGFLPVKGLSPGQWSGEALGASTPYPNAAAPAPLRTATLPVETGGSNDESIATLEGDFPNTDTSNDGYAGMYVLRLYTSAPDEGLTTTYDSADILVTGGTWSVVYTQALQTATTTKLAVSPSGSATYGAEVKLTATVTPAAAAGSVEFLDGSKVLKAVTVTGGTASLTTTGLPDGVQKLSASFTPTEWSLYTKSTSAAVDLKVSARATSTSLKASGTSIKKGGKLTLSAKETPSATGSVTFYNGKAKLGAVKVSKGAAEYSTRALSVGTHTLKATFTPSDTTAYTSSTSKVVKVTVRS